MEYSMLPMHFAFENFNFDSEMQNGYKTESHTIFLVFDDRMGAISPKIFFSDKETVLKSFLSKLHLNPQTLWQFVHIQSYPISDQT